MGKSNPVRPSVRTGIAPTSRAECAPCMDAAERPWQTAAVAVSRVAVFRNSRRPRESLFAMVSRLSSARRCFAMRIPIIGVGFVDTRFVTPSSNWYTNNWPLPVLFR